MLTLAEVDLATLIYCHCKYVHIFIYTYILCLLFWKEMIVIAATVCRIEKQ